MRKSIRSLVLAVPVLFVFLTGPPAGARQIDDDEAIDIELKSASLVETLHSLAQVTGRRLDVHPSVDGSVTIDLERVSWRTAIDQICQQHRLSCELLDGTPPVLRVTPIAGVPPLDAGLVQRLEPLATRPHSNTRGVDLGVRWTPAGGSAVRTVSDVARFDWAAPVHTVVSDASEPVLVRLVWIPFATDLHVVLPMAARCTEGGLDELEVLDPLTLPIVGSWRASLAGGQLELGEAEAVADPRDAPKRCPPQPTGKLEVGFTAPSSDEETTRLETFAATLLNHLGAYLLITPPNAGAEPLAALVALGVDRDGGQRLAVIRPASEGGVAVEQRILSSGETLTETLPLASGETLDLELAFFELPR